MSFPDMEKKKKKVFIDKLQSASGHLWKMLLSQQHQRTADVRASWAFYTFRLTPPPPLSL